MSREQILDHVRTTIAEMFELAVDDVHEHSKVFEELDLDSIDAIDLVARLQQFTGQRIAEDAMRKVRSVGDIVDLLADQLASRPAQP
ncbi:acyl carrier protein [Nannocystaceae bacterium ST9]